MPEHIKNIAVRDVVKNVMSKRKARLKKVRGFELVRGEKDTSLLPIRGTKHAAGYDLKVAVETTIGPGAIKLVPTGVKAYMQHNEVLYLYDRSSNPKKKGIVLINSVGVIDSDYYGNIDNDGHIFCQMKNITDEPITLKKGEAFAQAVFMPFLKADNDAYAGIRKGGFGSTTRSE